MMKANSTVKFIFSFVLIVSTLSLSAQKFAYIDSKYVLSHMPEYMAAQKQINELSAEWQAQVEQKYTAIEQLEKSFQAEKILLTEDMKKKREADINERREEAKQYQKSKFGVEGDLFKKREELVAPIQEQIFQAIEDIASQSQYMVVFDKASHSNMLYTNPKHDISDKVLKKMGLKPGEVLDKDEDDKEDSQEKPGEKPGTGTGRPGNDRPSSPGKGN
jgi:outer membrane protein